MFHLCEGDVPQLKNATLKGMGCLDMVVHAIVPTQFEIVRETEKIEYKRL